MDWINFIKEFFIFISAIFLIATLPGLAIIKLLKLDLSNLEKIIAGTVLGLVLSTLISFLLRFIFKLNIIDYLLPILYIIASLKIFTLKGFLRKIKIARNLEAVPLALLLLLGVFSQVSLVFDSGILNKDGSLYLKEYRDAMWHIGLTRELAVSVPPVHPGFAPEFVTNYHYFTHLFMAQIYNLTKIPLLDIYYHFFPLFFSFMLGISAYILGKKIFSNKYLSLLLVYLVYFASSLAYLLPLWHGNNTYWHESSFWASQTFSMLVNPSVSLSLIIFIIIIFFLYLYWEMKQPKLLMPIVLLSGTLISFKVYGGLLVLGGLAFASIINLFKRKFAGFKLFLPSLIVALGIFLPVSGKGAGNFLVFAPGWFLKSMVESPDRVYEVKWILQEQTYEVSNNLLGILRLRFKELAIFLVGNLGVRILGFHIIFLCLFKKIKNSLFLWFLIAVGCAGIAMPLLFIQNGSIANTIQFTYYSLIIGNILTCLAIKYVFSRNKIIGLFLVLIVLTLGVPTSLDYFIKNQGNKGRTVISKSEYAGLLFLKQKTREESIILLPPTQENTSSMYVSTLSERPSFYSDRLMAENTLKDFKKREAEADKFFRTNDVKWSSDFLKNNKISYIFLKKGIYPDFKPNLLPLTMIFKNDEVAVYKTNTNL